MKRKREENQILLTQYQVMLIDDLVFCLLGRGRLDLAIGELQREFPDPSQLATALSHSRYKVVMWALEHDNLKLISYLVDHTTELGAFDIAYHDNYKVMNQLLDQIITGIKKDDDTRNLMRILKVLLRIEPGRLIVETENIIKEKTQDKCMTEYLTRHLQKIAEELATETRQSNATESTHNQKRHKQTTLDCWLINKRPRINILKKTIEPARNKKVFWAASIKEPHPADKIRSIEGKEASKLGDSQLAIVDTTLPSLFQQGRVDQIIAKLSNGFTTPKQIERMLSYSHYKPFLWALENENLQLMRYLVDHTTERGKFLITCYDNYKVMNQWTDQAVKRINASTYHHSDLLEILIVLLRTKPDILKEEMERIINEKATDDKVATTLTCNLKTADNLARGIYSWSKKVQDKDDAIVIS